jgi:hypothetical protein
MSASVTLPVIRNFAMSCGDTVNDFANKCFILTHCRNCKDKDDGEVALFKCVHFTAIERSPLKFVEARLCAHIIIIIMVNIANDSIIIVAFASQLGCVTVPFVIAI